MEHNNIPQVYLDLQPLSTGHAGRGIGMYTRKLLESLQAEKTVTIITDPLQMNAAQVIHYPYFDLFFPTLPVKSKKKRVVTIHDVIPLEFPEQYKPGYKGKFSFLYQKNALRFVDTIITDSEYSKLKIIEKLGQPADKIQVIYLAAGQEFKEQTATQITEARTQLELLETYILYVGDINYNKNIPQLIKALKFLPDEIHLVCLGKNFVPQEIPEWSWIEAQIAMSDVTNRVHFLTDISAQKQALLPSVYAGALAYIQPSLSEGFGLPVLEALASGCPVISTRLGSLPEVCGEVALFTEPHAESIALAVTDVASWTPAERKNYVKKGIAWSETFSWKKTAQKTIEVYTNILQK